jgi:pimeloyl-ACP methyl ester carboxylesterase
MVQMEGDDGSHRPQLSLPRHTTRYWEAGPVDGALMIFLYGWPEIGLRWRAQIKAFASEGWRCTAAEMRGYGCPSAPIDAEAYALNEIVDDRLEGSVANFAADGVPV